MNTIKISVLTVQSDGKYKELYRQSVTVPDGVVFPYEQIISSLKILYPKSDFVQICV